MRKPDIDGAMECPYCKDITLVADSGDYFGDQRVSCECGYIEFQQVDMTPDEMRTLIKNQTIGGEAMREIIIDLRGRLNGSNAIAARWQQQLEEADELNAQYADDITSLRACLKRARAEVTVHTERVNRLSERAATALATISAIKRVVNR